MFAWHVGSVVRVSSLGGQPPIFATNPTRPFSRAACLIESHVSGSENRLYVAASWPAVVHGAQSGRLSNPPHARPPTVVDRGRRTERAGPTLAAGRGSWQAGWRRPRGADAARGAHVPKQRRPESSRRWPGREDRVAGRPASDRDPRSRTPLARSANDAGCHLDLGEPAGRGYPRRQQAAHCCTTGFLHVSLDEGARVEVASHARSFRSSTMASDTEGPLPRKGRRGVSDRFSNRVTAPSAFSCSSLAFSPPAAW